MTCSGRYATAWEYVSYWCQDQLLIGYDNSGGAGNLFLTDSDADFKGAGIKANVGMRLYNLTSGLDGVVTAVAAATLTATGVTWDDGDQYRIVPITYQDIARIELYLDTTSGMIHAARAAVNGCDCSLASWAAAFLRQINIIAAGVMYNCPCNNILTDEMRQTLLEWVNNQLELIRTAKLELCDGHTGSDTPYFNWGEMSVTEFAASRIIINNEMRNP